MRGLFVGLKLGIMGCIILQITILGTKIRQILWNLQSSPLCKYSYFVVILVLYVPNSDKYELQKQHSVFCGLFFFVAMYIVMLCLAFLFALVVVVVTLRVIKLNFALFDYFR